MTNPVFLACHQHKLSDGTPSVIGKIVRAWVDAKVGLWIIVEFAASELAEKYWQLYRNGFMRAVSVGFILLKSHSEIYNGENVWTFDEVELLEVSAVAVPSNRGALARSKQRKHDFIASKIAARKAQDDTAAEDDAFGLIGLSRKDFYEDELAGMTEDELAVLDLCLDEETESETDAEPDYGNLAKSGNPGQAFYDE